MLSFTICGIINERGIFSLKKTLCILLAALVAIELAACGAPTAATEVPVVVEFADPVLEAIIRGAIGQPEGGITLAQAKSITRLDLNDELQGYLSQETPIEDISGLEAFTNLESLDLSSHAITDITPLQELTRLTTLSLAGNPVADVSPLVGLTNLKLLILSGSKAQDYSALSNLVNLQVLMLDNSTITDISPLVGLTNLRQLYLAKTPVEDLTPLETIYANLEQKDFIIPSTLVELGFNLDGERHEAYFNGEGASFTINHSQWGPPSREDNQDIIRMTLYLNDEYKTSIGYYGVLKVYVCQMDKEGQPQVNYIYDPADGIINISAVDRQNAEQMIRAAMDVPEGVDPLLTPFRFFDEAVKQTFNSTPAKLFSLPYEPPTLKNLGFFADEPNAVYLYEQRGDRDVNMEVHIPKWGEREYDVRFNTPLSDGYRIVVTYHVAERKFTASADDDYQGGASFEYFIDTGEYIDVWCSYPDKTVEEYFIKAYNDPAIEDVYQHSIDLMVQYVSDRFGMTIEELYSLPTGE